MRAPVFLLTLSLAALPLALHAEDAAAPAEKPAVSLAAITVTAVAKHDLSDEVLASGLIGPVEQVMVQPQIDGQAIELLEADVGDRVTAGQVLARLSSTSLTLQKSQLDASRASAIAAIAQGEASLIEAQSSADEAARVANRTRMLADAGSSTKSAADTARSIAVSATARVTVATQGLEAAKAQLALVEAQIANLDLNLKRTAVTTPVSGEVIGRNAMVGGIASGNGAAMFTLIRDGQLELQADVAEQDVLRLAIGQTAIINVVGHPAPITGTVRLIEPTVDANTRLGRVRIALDESGKVRSGMFADATILLASRNTLAIPVSAVGATEAGAAVLKVTDGLVSQVQITTGIRDGGMIEVLTGLNESDLIVAKAGAFVRDGDHINPVLADAASMSN